MISRQLSRRPPLACSWLRPLAEGYLGPFEVRRRTSTGLWGHFFERRVSRIRTGIFVGFLTGRSRLFRHLNAQPPECVVAAFVQPPSSSAHDRLVRRSGSLFRQSYGLLDRYTPTRPRFEFREEAAAAIARHVPLTSFPGRLRARYARNFFIETLALLVRTRLPDYLRAERLSGAG